MTKAYNRFLACILAISMLASVVSYAEEQPVSGANTVQTSMDTMQQDINRSVEKLMALGIVQGKEDGQYHPEQPVTREEFAKLVVSMMGIEQSILSSETETGFFDVAKGAWSAPYVNAVSQSGIMKGYEGGVFMPRRNVTLAEAVTVIVRALGYRDEHLVGSWPNNYIAKSGELGLLRGIMIKHDNNLNRGIVALIVDRAFDAHPIKDGIKSEKTLLEDKMGIYEIENVKVLERYPAEEGEYVKIIFNEDEEFDGREFSKDEELTLLMKSAQTFINGEDVSLYVDSSDNILYVKRDVKIAPETGAVVADGDLEFDYITNAYSQKPRGLIKVSSRSDYIGIAGDAHIYLDGEEIESDELEDALGEDVFGSFIIKSKELEYASLVSWEQEDLYVKSIDAAKQTLDCISTSEYIDIKLLLSKYSEGYEIILIQNGQKQNITIEQLLPGDMINISKEQEKGEKRKIVVWRNSLTGRFERVSGGMNGQKITFRIQGQPELFELPTEFSYSYNLGKRVRKGENRGYDTMRGLEDFYNENVQIYKNWKGDIVYIQGEFSSNSDIYGVLINYGDAVRGEIKLYTHTGSKKVYAFEDSDEYELLKEDTPVGSILKYSLAKSGKIKKISDNLSEAVISTDDIDVIEAGDDFGEDTVTVKGKILTVDSDTVFFDYTEHNPDKVKKLTWDKFKNREVVDDVQVIIEEDDDYVRMMAIWDNMEGIMAETEVGYAVDNFSLGSSRYVEIYGFGNQTLSKYRLEDDYKDMILGGRLLLYQVTTGSDIKVVKEDDEFEFISGEIENIKGNEVTIEGRSYRLHSDVEVFEGQSKRDKDSLEEDQLVAAYKKNAKILLVELLGDQKDLTIGEGVLVNVDPHDYDECFTIEVDGVEKVYANDGNADYVFRDGYLQKGDYGNDSDITTIFSNSLGGQKPNIKFVYNRYTDEIRSIWVDKNR
ncbi:S-layer homology domain-containing protein [Peptoclostridium litorale DSM 5388]|uniref:Surface layer protein n=1 Tax=Peptoclostridium litorale DSM 5388 TaxID=1121324 RepID=A0A069RDY4_PEPLI|nr:S-layer homology domain-containing protein [Peptoclostridium litorale]KDR94958.1 surface layer protein [Peptoclostridium litorale DSM 5388]SIO33806.1 S-layer homology domain-containing protein [Peptoclostridium litorale DSM 5388]